MYTSKLKLTLHWLLIVVAFYVFWAIAYLVLVKFATSQIGRFNYSQDSFWSQITSADVFWFGMFIFGMAVVIFGIRKAMQYAPNPKIAAVIYVVLVILSVGILLNKLLETNTGFDILPHIVINGVFLIPMGLRFIQKDIIYDDEQDHPEDSSF